MDSGQKIYMKLGRFQYNEVFQLLIDQGEYYSVHFKEREVETQ